MKSNKSERANMIDSFMEFATNKEIDKQTLRDVLEESFRTVIARKFGSDANFDVVVDPDRGGLEIWHNRVTVEDDQLEDPVSQVAISEVRKEDPAYEVGEPYSTVVNFEDFGRRAILNLRQVLSSKILELQKAHLAEYYTARKGQIITAEVTQAWKKEVLLIDEKGNELTLSRSEMMSKDNFRNGHEVKAVVHHVDNTNGNLKIYLSRTSNEFLTRLLEAEIPEIADGNIILKKVARIPGERAKIVVESYDDRIDPVGACVGPRGERIRGVVRELNNEHIDVIQYSSNLSLFVQRLLKPAKISDIEIFEDNKVINVYLPQDQINLAIGRSGGNIRLARLLLDGYKVETYVEDLEGGEEDILLDEFRDVIDDWIIDIFKSKGYDTAKSIMRVDRKSLIDIVDLEEDTIDHVLEVLHSEFEDDQEYDDEEILVEEGQAPDEELAETPQS